MIVMILAIILLVICLFLLCFTIYDRVINGYNKNFWITVISLLLASLFLLFMLPIMYGG
jgi:hypothetical protein